MEKVEKKANPLFVNYNRRGQKPFQVPGTDNKETVDNGTIIVFPEYCVPASGSANDLSLNALSNSIYMEARHHNMSLSPFGPLDPIKFCLAPVFIAQLMLEIRRKIEALCTYDFSSEVFGARIQNALGISNPSAAQNEIASICKRYNTICSKIDSMMIPVCGIVERWSDHRKYIYSDDEGDRPHFYLYRLGGYYELDVNASSAKVGQLVFHHLPDMETIPVSMNRVSEMVDRLMADDDFVNFATEWMETKMPTFVMEKFALHIDKDGNEYYDVPALHTIFDLDDILSLENACFASPISEGTADPFLAWDLFEDVESNKLAIGAKPALRSLDLSVPRNALPVYVDKAFSDNVTTDLSISSRWITTHAKIKSEMGQTYLLRYVLGYAAKKGIKNNILTNVTMDVLGHHFPFTSAEIGMAGNQSNIRWLSTFSTEILGRPIILSSKDKFGPNGTRFLVPITLNYLYDESIEWNPELINSGVGSAYYFWKYALNGFKVEINLTVLSEEIDTVATIDFASYDYIVQLAEDSVNTFNEINMYNDCILLATGSIDRSRRNYRKEVKKSSEIEKPATK